MDIARNKKKRTGKYASTSTRYKEPMTSIRHPKSNQKKKKVKKQIRKCGMDVPPFG
ncbi:hypothetical protein ACKS23_07526 [Histoplasma ohiense]